LNVLIGNFSSKVVITYKNQLTSRVYTRRIPRSFGRGSRAAKGIRL
jgi:hypothetical protein